jgi:2-polyprenyl-3-methyl-5-hydroxy-6-metoxy-1,4-benzoquinol methylase
MRKMFLAMLRLRGIHFFATRARSNWLRSLAFDEKYRSGEWNFSASGRDALVDVIEQYANRGNILMMGCGDASVAGHLNPESFSTFCGVDLSGEAIRVANEKFADSRVRFEQADMLKFQCPRSYDIIVFSESLYYIRLSEQKPFLERLGKHLKPGGHFIVTIADAKRYESMLTAIRQEFRCIEDRPFTGSKRHVVVFN